MATLFAGPWVGELGWELFGWQSYLRTMARAFDRVVICSRLGHDLLYADFCDEFIAHDPEGVETAGAVLEGYQSPPLHSSFIRGPEDRWVSPICFFKGPQDFLRYGYPSPEKGYDVLLHARATLKGDSAERNWPEDRWRELVGRLRARSMTVASIGRRGAAACIEGSVDLRDIPLSELVDTMASSRLLIGPSSGPMHMASLCRCPHLVWTSAEIQQAIRATNRERYEKMWNPLRTPVRVLDAHGWRPSVDDVDSEIESFSSSLTAVL